MPSAGKSYEPDHTPLDTAPTQILAAAWQAREQAYAPYSGYAVGAALLSGDGQMVTGCNVENASYGLTCCAERVAAFQAVARGLRDWRAMAVVAQGEELPYPCGACRQVLAELAPQMTIVVANEKETVVTTMEQLLPHRFRLKNEQD